MARCAACGTTIVAGGVREGKLRFCNRKCQRRGGVARLAQAIPDEAVFQAALDIHDGPCPLCRRSSPVDVYKAHYIWSLLVISSLSTRKYLCCRRCATMRQLFAFFGSGIVGWWGFPFGLIGTPVQLIRNLVELGKRPRDLPSPALIDAARSSLAHRVATLPTAHPPGADPVNPGDEPN